MKNESGLLPVGRAVLVKPYQPERRTGLIEIPDSVLGRDQMIEQRAVVIEIGPCAWEGESVPRANVGDRVLVSKFSGSMAIGTADGEQYRFVNDRDIFAKIEVENDGH